MIKLLKADFYSIIKSKLFLIGAIVVVAYPLLMALIYLGLNNVLSLEVMGEAVDVGSMFNGKSLFNSSYSLANDLGMTIPVFAADFILLDISNGSLKNKIISGSSKSKIYLSHIICTALFNFVMINVCSLLGLLFNSLFLGYGVEITASEIGYIFAIAGMGSLIFIFVGTITTLIAMSFKNIAPTIIFSILVCIIFGVASQLLVLLDADKWGYLLGMVPGYGLGYISSMGLDLAKTSIILESVGALLAFSALNIILGIKIFKKLDIK